MASVVDLALARETACVSRYEKDVPGPLKFLQSWRVKLARARWKKSLPQNTPDRTTTTVLATTASPTEPPTPRFGLLLALVYRREQIEWQLAREVAATQVFDTLTTTHILTLGTPPSMLRAEPYNYARVDPAGAKRIAKLSDEGVWRWCGLGWHARGWQSGLSSSVYYLYRGKKEARASDRAWWNGHARRLGRWLKDTRVEREMAAELVAAQKDVEKLVFECLLTAVIKDDGSVSLDKVGRIEHSHVIMEKGLDDSSFGSSFDLLVRLYKENELEVLWGASGDSRYNDCLARDKNDYGGREVRLRILGAWETFAKTAETTRTGPFIEGFIHHLIVAVAARFIVDEWKYRQARAWYEAEAAKGHQRHTEWLLKAVTILAARISTRFLKKCMVEQEAVIRKQAGGNALLADKWARLAWEAWDLVK